MYNNSMIKNQIVDTWKEYELLDCGDGEKIERWKNIVLRRPEPQAIWKLAQEWDDVDAHYHRSNKGGGAWEFKKKIKDSWIISYGDLRFKVSPTGFKHTGIFPEQACNWDYMMDKIRHANRDIMVLNLFAYTGGATLACAKGGAKEVVHIDAAKGMVNWAKENMALSHLENKRIRFITDDALKFVQREKRRGRTYQAILMDPPSYGRGPNGELWKIEEQLLPLIEACMDILDDEPLFFLINSYTTGFSPFVLENVLDSTLMKKYPFGKITIGEVALPITSSHKLLPCGVYGLFESN